MIKREFDSIELVDRHESWKTDLNENRYIALKENSLIFVTYTHGEFETISFQKEHSFKIEDGDFLIFDENQVKFFTI